MPPKKKKGEGSSKDQEKQLLAFEKVKTWTSVFQDEKNRQEKPAESTGSTDKSLLDPFLLALANAPDLQSLEKEFQKYFDNLKQAKRLIEETKLTFASKDLVSKVSESPISSDKTPKTQNLILAKSEKELSSLKIPSQKNSKETRVQQILYPKEYFAPEFQSISVSQIKVTQPKNEYFTKKNFQRITSIEDGLYDKNPSVAVSKIFPSEWNYKPWDLTKPIDYYLSILKVTESVEIKHTTHKDSGDLAYSHFKILRVINPKDWSSSPSDLKSFPVSFTERITTCRTFSYWDYQQAWYNALLVQNFRGSHSRLVMFDTRKTFKNLPNWFIHWWDLFGSSNEILPAQV